MYRAKACFELMSKSPPTDAQDAPRALGPAECAVHGEDPRRGCQGSEERIWYEECVGKGIEGK